MKRDYKFSDEPRTEIAKHPANMSFKATGISRTTIAVDGLGSVDVDLPIDRALAAVELENALAGTPDYKIVSAAIKAFRDNL